MSKEGQTWEGPPQGRCRPPREVQLQPLDGGAAGKNGGVGTGLQALGEQESLGRR